MNTGIACIALFTLRTLRTGIALRALYTLRALIAFVAFFTHRALLACIAFGACGYAEGDVLAVGGVRYFCGGGIIRGKHSNLCRKICKAQGGLFALAFCQNASRLCLLRFRHKPGKTICRVFEFIRKGTKERIFGRGLYGIIIYDGLAAGKVESCGGDKGG